MAGAGPTLHLICGKAAAGKSTLSESLGRAARTVRISEDDWLALLFGDRMETLADYVAFSKRLRAVVGPHVTQLLQAGVNVVLDFPANTAEARAWMKGVAEAAGSACVLHYLDVPDAVCKARLAVRNADGAHPFSVSEEQFDRLTRYFEPPLPEEGIEIFRNAAP
ncbi:AAA family ATPase [Roseovarius sp. B08]|uniref:AAA family ATPase n=1 Tax=Roseovarius sp. B08 TaxID=3449223 RepID=UPI003EDCAB16